MNTGHDGSMSTVHANTTRDAISRIENMVQMGNMGLPMATNLATAGHTVRGYDPVPAAADAAVLDAIDHAANQEDAEPAGLALLDRQR